MRRLKRILRCRGPGALALAAGLLVGIGAVAPDCWAYTAAGDRVFPATGILPQIAPTDSFYTWGWTVPQVGGAMGMPDRASNFGGVFSKTITERLGVTIEESWTQLDRVRMPSWYGWNNLDTEVKFLAIDNKPHEFLLTLGLDREFGGTGSARIGAAAKGATTPRVYFGKGLGDMAIGYWRPLAVTGVLGYQISDSRPRPDMISTGFVVEYSIPYLQSKVRALPLPDFFRHLTPMTEVSFNIPAGRSYGARTTAMIAPGISYAGEGWEFGVNALIPASRATGTGVGVIGHLHIALDFLLPESIGRPLFSEH